MDIDELILENQALIERNCELEHELKECETAMHNLLDRIKELEAKWKRIVEPANT